jgi:hypothetical protein
MSIPGYVALQRAAAPWGDNNYWGQFDADTDLVNVAGAAFQIGGDLQAGDVAWVVGAAALYVCSDPTPGAAVWSVLGGGGGADSLQTAYDTGNTIVATAARPVALSNAVDTTDLLTVDRTFAGSGDGIEVTMGAATTGRGIRVVAGGSGTGVLVTDGAIDQTGISPGLIFQSQGNDLDIVVIGAGAGDINITSGGGAVGGSAGEVDIAGGDGLAASGGSAGGNGGRVVIAGGTGGAAGAGAGETAGLPLPCTMAGGSGGAGSATFVGAFGGNLNLVGGAGGLSGGAGGGAGGIVNIQGGGGGSGAADGAITIGTTAASAVSIGKASGTTIGFFGAAGSLQSAAYSVTNVTTDRAYDANSTTVDELADVLGTLISDLQALGLIG